MAQSLKPGLNGHNGEPARAIEQAEMLRAGAEARAVAAIADAKARMAALAATAGAHAEGLVSRYGSSREAFAGRTIADSRAQSPCDWKNGTTRPAVETPPPATEHGRFRDAVSVRAYYKAQNRGFWPGHETEDWLEAEREMLDLANFRADDPAT
jgi:hypothetical protein